MTGMHGRRKRDGEYFVEILLGSDHLEKVLLLK